MATGNFGPLLLRALLAYVYAFANFRGKGSAAEGTTLKTGVFPAESISAKNEEPKLRNLVYIANTRFE